MKPILRALAISVSLLVCVASPRTFTISGTVTTQSTVTLSGNASATTATDANGKYQFSVTNGTYTVTPAQSGYTFSPSGSTVRVKNANVSGVNFTASAIPPPPTYSISGNVSGSTATMTLSGASAAITTTDASGNYAFTGLANGSYVVAPSQSGYSFSPSTTAVLVNGFSVAGANFTASPIVTVSHTVTVDWTASISANVIGYNVYRGAFSGGPYTLLNMSLIAGTSFVDSGVSSGQTYYYVATAIDSTGAESMYSNEASAVIPIP